MAKPERYLAVNLIIELKGRDRAVIEAELVKAAGCGDDCDESDCPLISMSSRVGTLDQCCDWT